MTKKNTSSKNVGASKKNALVTETKKATASKNPAAITNAEKIRLPKHVEISQKAHEIYLERISKGEPGNPDSDWQQALDILKS